MTPGPLQDDGGKAASADMEKERMTNGTFKRDAKGGVRCESEIVCLAVFVFYIVFAFAAGIGYGCVAATLIVSLRRDLARLQRGEPGILTAASQVDKDARKSA